MPSIFALPQTSSKIRLFNTSEPSTLNTISIRLQETRRSLAGPCGSFCQQHLHVDDRLFSFVFYSRPISSIVQSESEIHSTIYPICLNDYRQGGICRYSQSNNHLRLGASSLHTLLNTFNLWASTCLSYSYDQPSQSRLYKETIQKVKALGRACQPLTKGVVDLSRCCSFGTPLLILLT